jgi:hypothetical protein
MGKVRALVIPEHYVGGLGQAMVTEGIVVISRQGIVPSYLHQYADMWARLNLRGLNRCTYWESIAQREPACASVLNTEGLLATPPSTRPTGWTSVD